MFSRINEAVAHGATVVGNNTNNGGGIKELAETIMSDFENPKILPPLLVLSPTIYSRILSRINKAVIRSA